MSTWAKGKRSKELKEIEDYYTVIPERRAEVIKLSKEATDIVEINRNTDKEAREKRKKRKQHRQKRR